MSQSPLFQLAEGETVAQKLSELTELHLDGVFPHAILARGFTAYYDRCIEKVAFLPGQVRAQVVGQDVYETTLTAVDREIRGACTCPYDDRCKHQAALLIFLIRDVEEADFEPL